ncbi:MAG: TraB/GumN family protein [Paludibacter sp.]|nr:TraB/GumN family protein [Paludibacter sp.]
MKKLFILFIILNWATVFPSSAQLLWKITGNGLKKPSYIFGTNELIPVAFLDSIPELYKTFNDCETVISEFVTNSIDATKTIQSAASIPGNKTLKDYISEKNYETVDKELKSTLKAGLTDLAKMRPNIVLNLYKLELFRQITHVMDDAQSDSYFQIAASLKGKKIIGLESVDQQIEYRIHNESIEDGAQELENCIIRKDSLKNSLLMFYRLYKSEKINDLSLLANSSNIKNSDLQSLTNKRISFWAKEIPGIIYNKKCFITVDVSTLAGDSGLIHLLQQKGFKVKPVEK